MEPQTPTSQTISSEVAQSTSQPLERVAYRLLTIDRVQSNGTAFQTTFHYGRAGKLARVSSPAKRFDFLYGAHTITSTVFTADTSGSLHKQAQWLYKLNASGRCYEAHVDYFNKTGQLTGQSVFTYGYNGTGQLELVKQGTSQKATFSYNANGDLFKSTSESTFEQLYDYDQPGPYAADLQSTKPGQLPLQGLIPDKSLANPWNLPYVNEYLPIFGTFRTHLPKRYQQHQVATDYTKADWSQGYSLNGDNQLIERTTVVSSGTSWKDSYTYQ